MSGLQRVDELVRRVRRRSLMVSRKPSSSTTTQRQMRPPSRDGEGGAGARLPGKSARWRGFYSYTRPSKKQQQQQGLRNRVLRFLSKRQRGVELDALLHRPLPPSYKPSLCLLNGRRHSTRIHQSTSRTPLSLGVANKLFLLLRQTLWMIALFGTYTSSRDKRW